MMAPMLEEGEEGDPSTGGLGRSQQRLRVSDETGGSGAPRSPQNIKRMLFAGSSPALAWR